MKLFKVEADYCGWDQYDSFIVWAKDEADAIEVAKKEADNAYTKNFETGATATEIKKPRKSGVVLGSFNAG